MRVVRTCSADPDAQRGALLLVLRWRPDHVDRGTVTPPGPTPVRTAEPREDQQVALTAQRRASFRAVEPCGPESGKQSGVVLPSE